MPELVMVTKAASAQILSAASHCAELMAAVFVEMWQWTDQFIGLNILTVVAITSIGHMFVFCVLIYVCIDFCVF